MKTVDFLVIGGGVMGISLATTLKRNHPDSTVCLIEKESGVARHASGRNSGVIHAGFYYTADSLKARFTRDGNKELHTYCANKGLRLNPCGKLVVCRNEAELAGLHTLKERGEKNGVTLEWISCSEAKQIEPHVLTHEAALWSPSTASVDPREVVQAMADDARAAGVEIKTGCAYLGRKSGRVVGTVKGDIEAGYLVNAAGLYADKIANEYGFSRRYRILPFKGLYLYAGANAYKPRVHIYPVPDLEHPFLGVHFTLTVDGDAKIGPTAIPAFWRENYAGLDGFRANEAAEIIGRELILWLGNKFGFRSLAWKEMQKYRKSFMVETAAQMLKDAAQLNFRTWGKPGIRAQLIDISDNRLEMDFIYEGDDRSFHLLNAVSPAFTCSLPMARFLATEIERLADRQRR